MLKKGTLTFAGDGFGHERLTGTGRANERDAFGDARAAPKAQRTSGLEGLD